MGRAFRSFDADICETMSPSRRAVLGTAGALFAWAYSPRMLRAAGARDPRFVCIVLRGALDGVACVAPVGDPNYVGLHRDMALRLDGPNPAFRLDSLFALHPAMPNLARLFRKREAAMVHAVATPYRERSHFDGQDVLESGYGGKGRVDSGWLNRMIAATPAGERIAPHGALGVGVIAPLVVRGSAPVIGWAPGGARDSDDDLAMRVLDLYGQRDPKLSAALSQGLEVERLAMDGASPMTASVDMAAKPMEAGASMAAPKSDDPAAYKPSSPSGMRQIAEGAARLVARDDGPRIAALALEGWDTHANEGGATGVLANRLRGLDAAIAAFEKILGSKWRDTVVMVVTEFGRTARINGTAGTDHGVGTVALLAGGAVAGGRVVADWPGLAPGQLFDGRDLRPTADLRAVAKGVLGDLFGVSARALGDAVFPDSAGVTPMQGLVASV